MRNFTNKPIFTCRNGLGQLCTYDRSTGEWRVVAQDDLAVRIRGALGPPAPPPELKGTELPYWRLLRVSLKYEPTNGNHGP